MAKFLLFLDIVIMGIIYSQETKCQESVFVKHNYKIINHGMFSFYAVNDNQTVSKVIFNYSLDLKKKSFVIGVESKDTLCINAVANNYLKDYSESDVWNRNRIGTSVEKYFMIFHKDFLMWNNSEKLNFFMQASMKEK